jgi:hypothetical protein
MGSSVARVAFVACAACVACINTARVRAHVGLPPPFSLQFCGSMAIYIDTHKLGGGVGGTPTCGDASLW